MTEALDRLCDAMRAENSPTPFVGAGFSMAATANAAHASWRGLLLEGIEKCERVAPRLPVRWAERMRDYLDNADAVAYVAAADDISRRLRGSYSAWSYGGAAAGGSHGPVVNSWRSASSLVRPHLAAVDR